jgi:hypothetical protein
VVRDGLRAGSIATFAFAILCVAGATLFRLAIGLVAPDAPAFASYYPFVLVATLVGGGAAGALAMLLSGLSYRPDLNGPYRPPIRPSVYACLPSPR